MEVDNTQNDNPNEKQPPKKGRRRKKQLYSSILQQMEFYFSDSNLTKDRLLSQLMQESPYVDLEVFLKFNKIAKLTTNLEDIRRAVKNSTLIELSEDQSGICRKEPVKVKTNVDECTVYVEHLKSEATHDWVKSLFSEFGKVVYVSIPKYKHTKAIKGFAFVEFDTEQEAQSALNFFESIGNKMPSNAEPEKLCSIATFEGNPEAGEEENASKKRRLDEVEDGKEDEKCKKVKVEGELDNEGKRKKKLKKEQKKKTYIKELGLQVLSKKEWKKMRNRYLDMQRKKMQEFKQHLYKARLAQPNYDDKTKKTGEPPEPKETIEKAPPKLEFVSGVVVRIKLPEPCPDAKKLKAELKGGSAEIKFVDIPLPAGSEVIHVRFNSNKGAQDFCAQEGNGERAILEGDEEKAYWDKLLLDRDVKFKKSVKKQRGRDKLRKKANKLMVTHIKFDE